MYNRPILRFPNPKHTSRLVVSRGFRGKPTGPGKTEQALKFQSTFDRLENALKNSNPALVLREDPDGIAPERALVFVTAGNIERFTAASRQIDLEVVGESLLDPISDVPDGFSTPNEQEEISRSLYVTMPTIDSIGELLRLWRAYSNNEKPPHGSATCWEMFDLLLELRTWEPEDRLTASAREVIADRLPIDDHSETTIEIEFWPQSIEERHSSWQRDVERWVSDGGGRLIDKTSISEEDYNYHAVLARIPAGLVRKMLDDPADISGLARIEGVHYILPQTTAQSSPTEPGFQPSIGGPESKFDIYSPIRAALLDGTPMVAHVMLDGGVVIEDINDLEGMSTTSQRFHASAMASLILRGDLKSDGSPVPNARVISVPVLIDGDDRAYSPNNKLFVAIVHKSLARLFNEYQSLSKDIFVVNFSIGIYDQPFSGQVSSLSRLLDWWSVKEGVLFVVSAGNVGPLSLTGVKAIDFLNFKSAQQQSLVSEALVKSAFERTLLSPAECLNALCVGAISADLHSANPRAAPRIVDLECDYPIPQITSALGMGPERAIKPDVLEVGGKLELRVLPSSEDTTLEPLIEGGRTGLVAAAPAADLTDTQRIRGTSAATALVTRSILQSAESLVTEGGPYEGIALPKRKLSLLTRALAVHSARWSSSALSLKQNQLKSLGSRQHARAKQEVSRQFGYGTINPEMMQQSHPQGATLIGDGTIQRDQARDFHLPLPKWLAGSQYSRSMDVTVAWFSPVSPGRNRYRLASLEAIAINNETNQRHENWGLNMKTDGPDANMIKRGSVWSCRLRPNTKTIPSYDEYKSLSIRVQCKDTLGNRLSPDEEIAFALVVSFLVEAEILFDIYQDIRSAVQTRVRTNV